jgi:hypothetical protein
VSISSEGSPGLGSDVEEGKNKKNHEELTSTVQLLLPTDVAQFDLFQEQRQGWSSSRGAILTLRSSIVGALLVVAMREGGGGG